MLFSYALLFSLFATFVAAAPTTIPEPRIVPSYGFQGIKGFLLANGAKWTRVKSDDSPANEIKWLLVEKYSEHFGRKIKDLYVEVEGTEHDFSENASIDKKTESDLVGTWERGGTGSRIKIEKGEHPTHISYIRCKVLVEGTWEREKKTGLLPGWKVFEEHVDFLTAKSGVWTSVGEGKFEVQQITFSEGINHYNLKELISSYKTKSGTSEEFPRWYAGGYAPDVRFGSTQWERKETGSKIEIVERDDAFSSYSYYFKMTAVGNWKGGSAKESQGRKSGGESAH